MLEDNRSIVTARRLGFSWVGEIVCVWGMHSGDWRYRAPGKCAQVRICRRCNRVLTRDFHVPGDEWIYVNNFNCYKARRCQRCDRPSGHESHIQYHVRPEAWADCKRCGHEADGPYV